MRQRLSDPQAIDQTLRMVALVIATLMASTMFCGCETIDKIRLKTLGITVSDPEVETAEWVLMQAVEAAQDKNAERGWEKFQRLLHTSERSTNALQGWLRGGWPRLRRQVDDYIADDGSFRIVDLKKMDTSTGELAGIDFYIESRKKENPTPCAVYIDKKKGNRWRIRRCSL